MVLGGNAVEIIISAKDKFSTVFNKAKTSLSNFRTAAIVAGGVSVVLAKGMMGAVKSANEVETGFARVNTLLDEGQDAQKIFAEYVKDSNVKLGNQGDQLDVLDGLYQTISAGITDVADAQLVMDAAIVSSVGGMADQEQVINALTKTMAAYDMGAEDAAKITDIFAGTVKAGQTTMGELAVAFPEVATMAGQMGISLEEAAGTFAGLTKFMSSSAETGTSLSQIMMSFLKPTDAMKDAVKILGYESAASMVEQEGLNASIKMLTGSVDNDSEAIATLFANKRALKGIMPLVGLGAENVANSIDIVTDSAGLANKQLADVSDTMDYKWGQAMSNAQNAQEELGNVIKEVLLPIVEALSTAIAWVTDKWENANPAVREAIVIFGLVTIAVGALSVAIGILTLVASPWLLIIAAIIIGITAAIIIFRQWEEMSTKLKVALLLLGGPIIWIIALIKNWKNILVSLLSVMIYVSKALQMAWQKVKDSFEIAMATMKNVAFNVWNAIVDYIGKKIQKAIDFINTLIRIANRVTKISIPLVPNVDLSSIKGELTDIGALKLNLEAEQKMLSNKLDLEGQLLLDSVKDKIGFDAEEQQKSTTTINIENVNGVDPDNISEALNEKLNNTIGI